MSLGDSRIGSMGCKLLLFGRPTGEIDAVISRHGAPPSIERHL
jgi:hypothetical protein